MCMKSARSDHDARVLDLAPRRVGVKALDRRLGWYRVLVHAARSAIATRLRHVCTSAQEKWTRSGVWRPTSPKLDATVGPTPPRGKLGPPSCLTAGLPGQSISALCFGQILGKLARENRQETAEIGGDLHAYAAFCEVRAIDHRILAGHRLAHAMISLMHDGLRSAMHDGLRSASRVTTCMATRSASRATGNRQPATGNRQPINRMIGESKSNTPTI
jgi:hypothetical protein